MMVTIADVATAAVKMAAIVGAIVAAIGVKEVEMDLVAVVHHAPVVPRVAAPRRMDVSAHGHQQGTLAEQGDRSRRTPHGVPTIA